MASSSSKSSIKLIGTTKKIESPLAKYNSVGQLTCIVCNSVVKNELVWTAHINGRQHREKVLALKKPVVETQFMKPKQILAIKRKAESPASADGFANMPTKKGVPRDFFDSPPPGFGATPAPMPIKSILKNARNPPQHVPPVLKTEVSKSVEDMETDDGFETLNKIPSENEKLTLHQADVISSNSIPEGFFDDPKMDAKVRQIEFKDPVEEEWNKFQKEIHDEVTASVAIQEEDQEESTAERQLEEIEEQMLKWRRVLELEQKKELYEQRVRALRESIVEDKSTSSSDDDDAAMDKSFDWRSKATS
ncbi:zinc finger protein 830-like [Daphnia carinata]|uniref:zinc finger protein 830-like n=1 Tax=Daphnia carinata TaxID=120202 RepID=UPI00257ED400|nr:zinc finger protein 830-like [Daphnia carinata]XP_057373502.1 zinc finger protein 830-like [Daphnia carinata]